MQKKLNAILCCYNSHILDNNIEFKEETHTYIIKSDNQTKYTSTTTWVHSLFPEFNADKIIENMMKGKNWKEGHKYWGLTPEQIKDLWNLNKENVTKCGTDLHYEIECFYNNDKLEYPYNNFNLYQFYEFMQEKKINYENEYNNKKILTRSKSKILEIQELEKFHELNKSKEESIEWNYFINFIKDYPNLKPYRTEWIIYDEESKIAGSIDMVYENEDGSLSIYDWKRSKLITRINSFNRFAIPYQICHLPDSNFWHYALQLNIYKYIIEKNYNKKVKELYLVRLHPDTIEKNYELIELPILKKEMDDLFDLRIRQIEHPFIMKKYT